jgi:hypothetical protein
VAYLENELESWPAWRRRFGDAGIPAILDAIRQRFDGPGTRMVLAGHSGGGSFTFGYLDAVAAVPEEVERIAFLDANYAYEAEKHRDKLTAWLKASDRHYLIVLAYNDAAAPPDGRPFVGESGGTWGRSRSMLRDLERAMTFTREGADDLERCRALGVRATFLLKEDPERKVLHAVQVERNGLIEGLLAGTALEGVGYTYPGGRAYDRFIRDDRGCRPPDPPSYVTTRAMHGTSAIPDCGSGLGPGFARPGSRPFGARPRRAGTACCV